MVKPINPEQVILEKRKNIPDAVIKCFNEFISKNWNGKVSNFKQKDILPAIKKELECDENDIFSQNWLDVEPIYREIGWLVTYDKPGYCENYEAFFRFEKKV